jgi:hypothetical protein
LHPPGGLLASSAFECGFPAVVDRAIQLRRVLLCDAAKEAKRRAEAVDES